MKIAIDFDGTLVINEFPKVGKPVPYAFYYLKKFQEEGALLILWTMRSGDKLQDAIDLCASYGVQFNGINKGIGDREWTNSPKAHANIYIDDRNAMCPLIEMQGQSYVDWVTVGENVLSKIKKGEKVGK